MGDYQNRSVSYRDLLPDYRNHAPFLPAKLPEPFVSITITADFKASNCRNLDFGGSPNYQNRYMNDKTPLFDGATLQFSKNIQIYAGYGSSGNSDYQNHKGRILGFSGFFLNINAFSFFIFVFKYE